MNVNQQVQVEQGKIRFVVELTEFRVEDVEEIRARFKKPITEDIGASLVLKKIG